ncbi:MAG: sigma-70 family RNA polymerase sigma factor [Terriglobales bacterium]
MPPASCRRRRLAVLSRPGAPVLATGPVSTPVPENVPDEQVPVLHCLPLQTHRGRLLQFHSFDESYLNRLRAGDFRTQEHFSAYFSALIKIKLGSRLKSKETIEDLRQETFARFFVALRDEKVVRPNSLGSFVNSICNNVLFEYYRSNTHDDSLDEQEEQGILAVWPNIVEALGAKETEKKVREILQKLPERDRRILRAIFLEERDKDEVCRELGVDRDYLRVLLHRAKQAFKASYSGA